MILLKVLTVTMCFYFKIDLQVSQTPDLQPYVVHEAWKAIRDTDNCTEKQPLTQVKAVYNGHGFYHYKEKDIRYY